MNQNNGTIIYQDKHILVCHKPAGLAVQSRQIGQMDLESQVRNYLARQENERAPQPPYLGLVHRLDQPVEGIVVFALNRKAAASLSAQLTDGRMHKEYSAVCCEVGQEGRSPLSHFEHPESGTEANVPPVPLTHWLLKDARTNLSRVVTEKTPGAKRAFLEYRIERSRQEEAHTYHLVHIWLHTGRHHQIRVQMAAAGLPLYGDRKYNPKWEEFRSEVLDGLGSRGSEDFGSGGELRSGRELRGGGEIRGCRLALCASRLTLEHPATGKEMTLQVTPWFEVGQEGRSPLSH